MLTYLAGLTCTEDNGCVCLTCASWHSTESTSSAEKGGFMRDAAAEGIAIIFPDTSPRGADIEGEQDDWDFGIGSSYPAPIFYHVR